MQLIDLLEVCINSDKYSFVPHLSALSLMLARAIADSNPEMKQRAALFAGKLCRELPDKAGVYMQLSVQSLAANLTH